jgi:hypothetical protein
VVLGLQWRRSWTARGGAGKKQGNARVREAVARVEKEGKDETADGTKKRTQIRFSRGDRSR